MLHFIENEYLKVAVNDEGATLDSIVYLPNNEERLWQGEEYWNCKDVAIFPVVGHAGEFSVGGKTCKLKPHGIVRYAKLFVENKKVDEVTLALESDEATRENYPYDFYYSITFKVVKNSLKVTYFVRSKGGNMPFYVGGHPALKAPGGSAQIEFERAEDPILYPIDSDKAVCLKNFKSFIANKEFFKECKTFQLGSVTCGKIFATTTDGYTYTYQSNCPLWAFWSKEEGGDYICVEPWWGINDFPTAPKEITLKPFINFDSGAGSSFSYTLTINKN